LSRYGWGWQELLHGIPYADIIAQVEASADETRERWMRAAFIGWQVYLTTPLPRGKRHLSFMQWLAALGLHDERRPRMTLHERAREKQRAEENVRRVIEAFRRPERARHHGDSQALRDHRDQ
jgi:hypothetical protein